MPAYANIIATEERAEASNQAQKKRLQQKSPADDVVVSGMAGRFPESSSVSEFSKNLYEGVDMVTEDDRRWTPGLFGLPHRSGKLPNISNFDASFFNVSPRQAHCMDPQLRLLLEVSHEAIFDAGIHPNALRGKRVGVYVGVSGSETEEFITQDPDKITGYELTGCCRSMFANRLSYTLDLKGPSFAVDTACSSALVALTTAWSAISDGEIDAALVAGSSLTLKPQSSLQFNSLSMLSEDGSCKAFDARANGYVRSEAISAVFLQKRKDASRIYAHVVQALTNTDGHKGEGITFPSGAVQKELLQEVYRRAELDPASVTYVEAHGTGTKAGDPQELNAIADVFCANRSEPLLIGSVKSNMGHAEPASGLCAMVKVLLAMQKREIPSNLHFQSPNPDIAPLNDGRLKVVSQNTPWCGPYAAINCFGFGGANVHVLLKASDFSPRFDNILRLLKPAGALSKSPSSASFVPEGGNPRLVLTVGRTEQHVEAVLNEFRRNRDVHFASLLDNIAETKVSRVAFPYRGYTIVGGNDDRIIMNVNQCPSKRTPIWLIFSGMGSQWRGCGRALLDLPPFDDVIQRCRSALLPFGVDVVDVITREEPDPMQSTTYAFTAIAAVQVGLVEVLKSIGLTEFDGFVGHSVGELGCGYADGALTAEQTVLAAYWRGRTVGEAGLPQGKMAAVGLSAEDTQKWIGNNSTVAVACRNAANSVTISGPKEDVELVQEKLDAEGIFCRSVDSGGIAFHHSSLRKAAPRLLSELQKVILSPVRRSSKWISSSIPEEKWNSGIAKKASAEYLVNNLVSPVLFAEAIQKIPEGARVIEVSPHALMQAVLRRALPSCTLVPLIRKESKDVLSHLLESLGKLYISGEKLNMKVLYSFTSIPVPLSTPSIGSLVKWDHSVEWDVAKFTGSSAKSEFKVNIDLNDPSLSFLEGHTIDGRVLFPATGYMTLAWKALAKLVERKWEELPVTFSDIILHQATVLSSSNSGVTFTVRLLLNKGEFEVLAGETMAASGKIHVGAKETVERRALSDLLTKAPANDALELTYDEVYKELRLRGYQYGGDFRGIRKADLNGTEGELAWKNNWISLLDTLLQFSLLGSPMKGLYLPTRIRKVYIEPSKFYSEAKAGDDEIVKVNHSQTLGITMCPGVEIHGLKATMAPRRLPADSPILEGYQFFPNFFSKNHQMSENLSHENAAKLLLGLVLENTSALKVRIAHVLGHQDSVEDSIALSLDLLKGFDVYPLLSADYVLNSSMILTKPQQEEIQSKGIELVDKIDTNALGKLSLLVVSQSQMTPDDLAMIASLNDHAFILVDNETLKNSLVEIGFVEVSSIEKFSLSLLRKAHIKKSVEVLEIDSQDRKFSWVETLKEELLKEKKTPLWLVTNGVQTDGLLGMAKCLRREPGGDRLRCIIDPENVLEQNSAWRQKILAADLAYNIIYGDVVGTMRHLPLPVSDQCLSEYAYLNVLTRGDLSSLTWLVAPPPSPQEDGEAVVSCFVNYAPLNFRDIMLASGKLPPDALPGSLAQKECILGLEFAGVTAEGVRVMGLVAAGGLASSVSADPHLMWQVPDEWTLQEAATVPVVYATAYYALVVRGGLEAGESVLIHAGSGGVGQASISIVLARGCTVFTTVSSEKKRNFLKERFPQLTDKNIANSRDATFEYHIMEQTLGKGVDLVLNSLAGDLLQASIRCLKEHGRFLEIGKADLANNTALGMSIFLKNVTFHGILLDALIEGSVERKKALQKVLYDGIASGEVKPLAATTYVYHEAEEAFRFMASGKHIGKVLLEVSPEGRTVEAPKRKTKKRSCNKPVAGDGSLRPDASSGIPSSFRLWTKPNMVYIVTGGLGGLGLELADWLLSRGARKLVLTSRRGIATGYQALCVKRWRKTGASVRILQQDASTAEGAEKLLEQSAAEGSIGGIFHLAMVLEDSVFENQNAAKFQKVCRVKADGAIHLDAASRKLCPDLHLWVTFSSVACGKGNAGQANYGWANSVSERVVEERVRDGLPGCAIQWGGIGDVGVLADTLGDVEVAGTRPQSLRSVLVCLDYLIGSGVPVVGSFCLSSKRYSGRDGKSAKSLVTSLANILGIRDVSKAPMNVSLGDLGMDSLMAVEIKQTLEREADVVLATEQIRELTIGYVQELENQGKSLNNSGGTVAKPSEPTTLPNSEAENAFSWMDFPLVPKDVLRTLNRVHNSSSASPLFLAAPIQGTCDVLAQVAANIKTPVIGLQYSPELPSNNVVKLASALIERIEEHLPEGPFHLGGYSYGASVAFEIASQLELKGRKPLSLVLLDGSHSYVSGVIGTYKNKYVSAKQKIEASNQKEQEMILVLGQSEALVTYALQFCPVDAIKLRNSLVNMPSFDTRLDFIANTIVEHTQQNEATSTSHLTAEEIKMSASFFYDRLVSSIDRSTTVSSISLSTLLVRAAQNTQLANLGQDYGLSQVVSGDLSVKEAAGTHESFISGKSALTVAQFINEFLSVKIKQKNDQ